MTKKTGMTKRTITVREFDGIINGIPMYRIRPIKGKLLKKIEKLLDEEGKDENV